MKNGMFVLAAALTLSVLAVGCYTQVMSLQEYAEVRQGRAVVRPDASYALNYNQRCVTCHTTAELDDRYIDMELQRDMTAHGRRIDPTMWRGMADVPYAEDVYFPRPVEYFPPIPWWIPPAAVSVGGGGTEPAPAATTERPRTTGSTRESTRERGTTPAAQSPQSTASTPAASTAPPASVAAPSSSGTAAPSVRPRDTGNDAGGGRTRNDGATRDDGSRPR